MTQIALINKQVKKQLSPSRYKHTLGVMRFAVKLAEFHGESTEKASIAALLHDYCKSYSDADILKILESKNKPIHSVVKKQLNLAHGQVAAILARQMFNIEDDLILNAIEHHTFGCIKMSKLDKIIYLADSLEENRSYPGVEAFRITAMTDLNQAVIDVVTHTLSFELARGRMVHENSVLMRNALLEEV